jgi:apolipoprotein N-acyltransferase
MLLRIAIAVALFGAAAALGAWWATDTFQRVLLWSLLIWLLFESIEAILSWDHHPWRSYAITLWSFLRDHASAALAVPLAFVLTGIGVALIYTVVGRRTENDIWMLIGILVILAAIAAVGLVIQPHRPRAGRHGS